jgi:hypothetical protein
MTDAPYIPIEDAAEILELNPRQVQRLTKLKKFPGAFRLGKGVRAPWALPTKAVYALKAERDQAKQNKKRAAKPGGSTAR